MPAKKRKETDAQALDRLNAEWGEAASRGDVDAVVALYAVDGSLVWPGTKAVHGTRGIKRAWKQMLAEPVWIRFTSQRVVVSGDLASDFGKVEMRMPPKGPKQTAKYLVVWKKVRGNWKVLYDAWNENAPAAPAAPAKKKASTRKRAK
jgi:uncharacterized protein (TIGR02246 family)